MELDEETPAGELWSCIRRMGLSPLLGALSASFVYDDIDQIANNPALQSWHDVYSRFILSPVSLTSQFLGSSDSTYRPLFWMSLAVTVIFGADASGFHFTNLFLHC